VHDAVLILQDGKCFPGKAIGKKGKCIGEVCFTTSMTGYQHIMTDPSFADQIITFTFPHIGNVGINNKDNESKKIFAAGVVIKELSPTSHPSSHNDFDNWLEQNNVVGISEVDTRALTRHVRSNGSQNGIICASNRCDLDCAVKELGNYRFSDGIAIINKVSLSNHFNYDFNFKYKVVIIDFGVKAGIALRLMELGCAIELIKPVDNFAQRVLNMKPDGIILSNGPGDPWKIWQDICSEIDLIVRSDIPVFGICMGHQLLAISLGAKTVKMINGHRGSNHPVREISSGRIEITSQNHGFVVDLASLPNNIEVSHISLFDNSIEGIIGKDYPVFSVQYHPEGSPGTCDAHYLFKRFIELCHLCL
jgi:carbamoyl-phosphate synthase small subunit